MVTFLQPELALEANPGSIPHLGKTRRAHPAADRMKVNHCLVGDPPAPPRQFSLDPGWMGMGSTLEPADTQGLWQKLVAVCSVDEIPRCESGPVAGRTLLLVTVMAIYMPTWCSLAGGRRCRRDGS